MQRIVSSTIVIVAMFITAGTSRDSGVAKAAIPATLTQTKSAGPAGNACSLLTKEDAAAALGEAVKGPESSSQSSSGGGIESAATCEYTGSGLHKVHLNLMRLSSGTATMYRAFCDQKGKEGLSGLGDIACWYNEKHEELQVLKGTTFISIELRKAGNPHRGHQRSREEGRGSAAIEIRLKRIKTPI